MINDSYFPEASFSQSFLGTAFFVMYSIFDAFRITHNDAADSGLTRLTSTLLKETMQSCKSINDTTMPAHLTLVHKCFNDDANQKNHAVSMRMPRIIRFFTSVSIITG